MAFGTRVLKHRKAPCSFIVDTWALKGLPYHDFEVYAYTIKLHGAFGTLGTWTLWEKHAWELLAGREGRLAGRRAEVPAAATSFGVAPGESFAIQLLRKRHTLQEEM